MNTIDTNPVRYRAVVYLDSGEPIEAPGIHGHVEAFAAGFDLAVRLKEEGKKPAWVYTIDVYQ